METGHHGVLWQHHVSAKELVNWYYVGEESSIDTEAAPVHIQGQEERSVLVKVFMKIHATFTTVPVRLYFHMEIIV
jgi:hypothetical protein